MGQSNNAKPVKIERCETPSDKLFLYEKDFSFFADGWIHSDTICKPSELNTTNQVFFEKLYQDLFWLIMSFLELDDLVHLSHTSSNFRNYWFKSEEFLTQCKSRPDLARHLLFIGPQQDNLTIGMKYYDKYCQKLTSVMNVGNQYIQREFSIGMLGEEECGKTFASRMWWKTFHMRDDQKGLNHLASPKLVEITENSQLTNCKGLIFFMDLKKGTALNELELVFDNAMKTLFNESPYERSNIAEMLHSRQSNICSICILGIMKGRVRKISAGEIATFMKGLGCTNVKMHELRIQYFEWDLLREEHQMEIPVYWIASHLSLQMDLVGRKPRASRKCY